MRLEPVDDDLFYCPGAGFDRYRFRFVRSDDGKVVKVFHGPAWYVNGRVPGSGVVCRDVYMDAFSGTLSELQPLVSVLRGVPSQRQALRADW